MPALAARFAIGEEGLRLLRHWVGESGVRWGLDDDNVRELDLPPPASIPGRHYAYAARLRDGQQCRRLAGHFTLRRIERIGRRVGGQLADLLAQLSHWRQILSEARPLEAWLPLCRQLLDAFFAADSDTEVVLALIEQQWQQAINFPGGALSR